jgi:DNA polymerase-3 subunit epsilon
MREVIFDTETTGLDPSDGHRICEIGCVELVNRIETGRIFHAYVNPCRPMPAEAEAVHGLSDSFLATKPTFAAIARDLIAFIGDARLVAHNAEFDRRFLNWELRNCGEDEVPPARVEDTLVIARRKFPGAKHSLDALCARFQIDLGARSKHGALLDAQLLARVYVELTGGRQIGLSLAAVPAVEEVVAVDVERRYWPPRAHEPSAEERARHAEFLKLLTNPIWERIGAA